MDELTIYCNLMEEIKVRVNVVQSCIRKQIPVLYPATTIETAALQLRKILELIAFGSLVAHKEEYARQYEKFSTHWHAERILRDVARINPDFYPKPIQEVPSKKQGIKNELVDIKEGFLSKDAFIEAYNALGDILHAKNPFSQPADYPRFEKIVSDTISKIIKLLNTHMIRLYSSDDIILVHMQEQNGKAKAYTFSKSRL